jgi:proteasome lid subunit RPN8/RPN11
MRDISISEEASAKMVEHARATPREECCGLLAGRDGVIAQIFPAENAAERRSVAYEIAPKELFRLMREMRAATLDFLGIYHSHPQDENYPSPRDLERAYYPDAAYFIVSPRDDAAQPIRAFAIRDGHATELAIKMVELRDREAGSNV